MSDPEPYLWPIPNPPPCQLCRGEEYVEADDRMILCPRCHGNGLESTGV